MIRSVVDRCRVLGARLEVEFLEDRSVPAPLLSGGVLPPGPSGAIAADVYTESNNPTTGQNAVLGFHRSEDGSLTQFGSFPTGGTGELNIPKVVGPDDGDQQVVASPDGQFVFAVNEGSGSVTAFRVGQDGGLIRVGTYDTGGTQPDSIGIADDKLYVANRGDATATQAGTVAPSITGFTIGRDGSLTAIPGASVSFPVGTFVTQTLISPDGRFLFANVASLSGATDGNTLAPFQIRPDGSLQLAPGGDVSAGTNTTLLLGAAANPHLNIVYSGITAAGQVGVFTYDETGRTSFVGASADQGKGPCWCAVSTNGRFLYVANTATDSVAVYSLADPLNPVEIQEFALGGPHLPTGATGATESQAFQIGVDPSGRYLYVVSQSDNPAFPQGNQLHTLAIARDGTLTEPNAPVTFAAANVPADAHPQGVAVVAVAQRLRGPGGVGFGDDSGWGRQGNHDRWENQFEPWAVEAAGATSRFDFGDVSDGLSWAP